MAMPRSRGLLPVSPHVRIYSLVHLPEALPRGNYHPTRTFDSATLPPVGRCDKAVESCT